MTLLKVLAVGLALLAAISAGGAAVVTKALPYRSGETEMTGYLAYDDARSGRRAGVLVFHEWWGLNDYPKERARQLARLGYVALAADMYGAGKTTTSAQEAGQLAGQFRGNWERGGRDLMRLRARAALAALAADPHVDPDRLAAIGYCFGGTTVLELAYSGAALKGIVSIHGGLTVPQDSDLKQLKASVLILHGADDPTIKAETITALQEALRKGRADWEMVYYGGARHAFSNPASPRTDSTGYNATAARRSWQATQDFLAGMLRGG